MSAVLVAEAQGASQVLIGTVRPGSGNLCNGYADECAYSLFRRRPSGLLGEKAQAAKTRRPGLQHLGDEQLRGVVQPLRSGCATGRRRDLGIGVDQTR